MNDNGEVTLTFAIDQDLIIENSQEKVEDTLHEAVFGDLGFPVGCSIGIRAATGDQLVVSYSTYLDEILEDQHD